MKIDYPVATDNGYDDAGEGGDSGGGGGGFGVVALPRAVFTIRAGRVRWHPAVSVNLVVVAATAVAVTYLRARSRSTRSLGRGWHVSAGPSAWKDRFVDSADVRAFFERVSGDWDSMRSSFYNEKVIDALVERAEVTPKSTVVDVGTGTGFVAAGLASRAAAVLGVDNSPAMLAVAAQNLRTLNINNVRLAEGELDALPLEDDSVDAAVANMVLHHAPDPAAMLTEMARVVRPGGIVAISDEQEHEYEWMRTEQADLWLGFTQSQVEGFLGNARLTAYGYDSLGMQ